LSVRDPIPVASVTARGSLITTLTGLGITASTSNPIFVVRADAPAGRQLEWTFDGTNWAGDGGWQAVPLNTAGGVVAYTTAPYNGLQYRTVYGLCTIAGAVTRSGGLPAGTLLGTLPPAAAPSAPIDALSNVGQQITIRSDGTITAGSAGVANPCAVTAVTFPIG
jgi:hypothetical protein